MNTISTRANEIKRTWHLIDLKDFVLGRAASQMATLLMGKNKVNQSDNLDVGDYVVAINSDQLKVTGNKLDQKVYYRHSGYPGGLKSATLGEKMAKDSRQVVEKAVKNMLPKNKYQQPRLRRLKVFTNDEHPYAGQIRK